jgi:hypothetical protein
MQQFDGRRKQRGATFLGGLVIAAILGAALYVVIRLYPLYWEYYEVVSSLESVAKQNAGGAPTIQTLKSDLNKKWSAGYVDTIQASDIQVTKSGDGYELTADYRAERPFIGNVSLVVDFYKSVKVD